jgi:hypothetical protein
MIQRKGNRVPIQSRAVLASNVINEGRLVDVSKGGCAIEGAMGPRKGDSVQLRFGIPDAGTVHIPLAIVRWISGPRFGIEFIRTNETDMQKLSSFIRNMAEQEEPIFWV